MRRHRRTIYGVALTLVGLAVPEFSDSWPWLRYVLLLGATALVAFDLIGVWHAKRQRSALSQLRLNADESNASQGPRILPVRVYVEQRSLIAVWASAPHALFFSANVNFRNDPIASHPNAEAQSILAEITFHRHGQTVVKITNARWGDTDQPAVRMATQPYRSLIDLNTVSFHIGETHELNVAIKHPEQASFYAFDNSTHNYNNWENPAHKLTEDRYDVVVRLRGAHLDQEYYFAIRNLGIGLGLVLEPATG